jgi:hypothetical protein
VTIDGYRYLPRSLKAIFEAWPAERLEPIPWTPLGAPLPELTLCLVTTAQSGGHSRVTPPRALSADDHGVVLVLEKQWATG